MAQHRSVLPRLSLPPHHPFQPQLSINKTARVYPSFTPTLSNNAVMFSPSLTPTPSKRPHAPQGPLWLFTLLHMLSLYTLHGWLSALPQPPPLALFSFFPMLVAAFVLNIIYRPWKGRNIPFLQWGFTLSSGAILALSFFLCFEGLRSCGPLETILADFVGSLVAKVLFGSASKSSATTKKARGLVALLLGVFLLSHGWARMSCSPIAVDVSYRTRLRLVEQSEDCMKVWSLLAPLLGGFLSGCQRIMGARLVLKNIGKKRIHVLSYAMASVVLFPFALLQLAMAPGHSPVVYGSSFWSMTSIVAFGMIVVFFSEFYTEEKLFLPVHSIKAFQIVTCCLCGLELLYGLDISLVGFLFCTLVLGLGVQELASLQGYLSWEDVGSTTSGSLVYTSWIRQPLQHMFLDKKSRKIAIFLLINTGFMVVEFFYGFLSNSLGLISDACHMLFDCAALAIGLYASYISRLPQNSRFNYGYGRFEVVSGYANAVLLVLVASLIVLESIERILEPPEISTQSLLLVSVGGLLVNIVGLIFFHEEHHHAHSTGGSHSCSHSHSSHQPPQNTQLTSIDTRVNMSSGHGNGSSHHHHVVATKENGHWLASAQAEQQKGSPHDSSTGLHQHDGHVSDDHDHHHHVCSRSHVHDHTQGHDHHLCTSSHVHDHIQEHDHVSHGHQSNQHNLGENHNYHDHCHGHDHDHHNHGHDHDHHDHGHSHHYPGQQLDDIHQHDQHHHHHEDHVHEDDNCDHDHHHDHHHHMDHNMYGIFLHVLADTLGSVGVVISTLLIKYKGWLITDPACSIFLSALIIGSVVPLLKNSAEILLQRVPRHNEKALKIAMERVGGLAGVRSIGRIHLWSFTNMEVVGSLHLQIAAGSDRKLLQERAMKLLHGAGIQDLTLQIEEVS